MIRTEKVRVGENNAEGVAIKTNNSQLLIIKAPNGLLGCGYINADVAAKFDDVIAIVRGVNSFDDMLNARVNEVSEKAVRLGIKEGMSGEEALHLMF